MTLTSSHLDSLIRLLAAQEGFSPAQVETRETHISWVILTADNAYKIKKPVNPGFLDFSTLSQRKYFCYEEYRLNRRFAEKLYTGVVTLCGADGTPVDYAVKMQRFDHRQCFDELLAAGRLQAMHLLDLATQLATWIDKLPGAALTSPYGSPRAIYAPVRETLDALKHAVPADQADTLTNLDHWCENEYQQHKQDFLQRKETRHVIECHGDLHLGNIVWLDHHAVPFDCIEFDPNLRWIDIINEIAFTLMDLARGGKQAFSNLLLGKYLEYSNDYAGLAVLRFYLVYRALVRAKIQMLRSRQAELDAVRRQQCLSSCSAYIALAKTFTVPRHPCLLITHGLSGSGKSTVTDKLSQHTGMLYLRSDVLRKKLYPGSIPEQESSQLNTGLYSQHMTDKVYRTMLHTAEFMLKQGYSVIVDASFLNRQYRDWFFDLARRQEVRFTILHLAADSSTLARRVETRQADPANVSDADKSVLAYQLKQYSGLEQREKDYTLEIDTTGPVDARQLAARLKLPGDTGNPDGATFLS